MNTQKRRYVFIDFDNLKLIKFKKLQQVCDKVYVLIDTSKDKYISLTLVQQLQKLGPNLKWVVVNKTLNNDLTSHMCFILGKLHNKVNKDIEFAILSNNNRFDSIITFINEAGRSCKRVTGDTQKKAPAKREEERKKILRPVQNAQVIGTIAETEGNNPYNFEQGPDLIQTVVDETIRRLKTTGKRPQSRELLSKFIILYNQESVTTNNINQIIDLLLASKHIFLKEGRVLYAI